MPLRGAKNHFSDEKRRPIIVIDTLFRNRTYTCATTARDPSRTICARMPVSN